MTLILLSI